MVIIADILAHHLVKLAGRSRRGGKGVRVGRGAVQRYSHERLACRAASATVLVLAHNRRSVLF